MWNWKIEASAETKADPKSIWNCWKDVPSWPKWDHELEWSLIEGPFARGTKGKLKPKGWPETPFCITLVERDSYQDETILLLTKVVFTHQLQSLTENKTKITHRAEVKGFLAPILRLTLGRKLKKGLPIAVPALARRAENE